MGFLDYLSPVKTGKKLLELQMALMGKHVFTTLLSEDEKKQIQDFVRNGLETGGFKDKKMEDLDVKVRYLLIALAMKKTGKDKEMLKDFKVFVKNPFAIEKYSAAL
ncbi:MAG: hypothetical protein ACE5EZ_06315, partial [Thermodesulfobacteriota bacterium]